MRWSGGRRRRVALAAQQAVAVAALHVQLLLLCAACAAALSPPHPQCSAALEKLCSGAAVQQRDEAASCESCLLAEWSELAKAGCSLKTTEQFCQQHRTVRSGRGFGDGRKLGQAVDLQLLSGVATPLSISLVLTDQLLSCLILHCVTAAKR